MDEFVQTYFLDKLNGLFIRNYSQDIYFIVHISDFSIEPLPKMNEIYSICGLHEYQNELWVFLPNKKVVSLNLKSRKW